MKILLISIALTVGLAGLAWVVWLPAPGVQVGLENHPSDVSARRLEAVLKQLEETVAQLDQQRVADIPEAAHQERNLIAAHDDSILRGIYERIGAIESALRLGTNQGRDLQIAVQTHGQSSPKVVDDARIRFGSARNVREAFLFYSRKQLVDMLGPPCEVSVAENDVEQWKYRGSDGAALVFLIHNDLVFNAWM